MEGAASPPKPAPPDAPPPSVGPDPVRTPSPHLIFPYPPPSPPRPPGRLDARMRAYGLAGLGAALLLAVAGAALWMGGARQGEALTPEQQARLELWSRLPARSAPPPSAPLTGLSVVSLPPGAAVRVESDPVGETPVLSHRVGAGVYVVSLSKEGYAPFDTLVFVGEGEVRLLFVELRPEGVRAAPTATPIAAAPIAATPERPPERTLERTPEPPAERSSERVAVRPVVPAAPEEVPSEVPAGREALAQIARGSLQVVSEPAGAPVYLDGRRVGETPLSVADLEAGSYEVALRLDGYVPHRETVEVRPEHAAVVRATLAAPTGAVSILVQPWGSIFIDGVLHRQDTDVRYRARLSLGTHTVRAVHPQLGAVERTVEVTEDGEAHLVIDLNSR